MPRFAGLFFLFIVPLGCSGRSDYGKYVAGEAMAQKALEDALTAWKEGKPPGLVEGASPPVAMNDSPRRSKRRLKEFTVLGTEPAEGGFTAFNVRLVLDGPSEEVKARFVVVGKDPLRVFSQDDFEAMGSWENKETKK